MNLIPSVNGSVKPAEGSLSITLPLIFEGEFSSFSLFPLLPAAGTGKEPLLRFEDDPSLPLEGYELTISPSGIEVKASAEAGRFYAVTTLDQLIQEYGTTLPCLKISDMPTYSHRGFMLDCGRHFFSVEEIKKILQEMGRLKLNKFHWHLSEDQGYRIESKQFPVLNTIGSCREEADGSLYAHYYTQEEIKEVVAFAAQRQIEVIPEIDLPGHTTAIVASMPELGCSGETVKVQNTWGIHPHILCAGKERVYAFLEALLEEVLPLFPGKYFHIGGDEAPKSEWKKCPDCQAMIRRMGLKDEEALQAYFTRRLVDFLKSKGKIAIGWNEILMSGTLEVDEQGPVVQYWNEHVGSYSKDGVEKGFSYIFSNTNAFYLDYDPALVSLKAGYVYEPVMNGLSSVPKEQVLGLEAPLWSEYVADDDRLETMVFPRLLALAENAWAHERPKDFKEFYARAGKYVKVLEQRGFHMIPLKKYLVSGPLGLLKFGKAAMAMANRAGAAEQKDNLPPEMKAHMKEIGRQFITNLMHYNFTSKEIAMAVKLSEKFL